MMSKQEKFFFFFFDSYAYVLYIDNKKKRTRKTVYVRLFVRGVQKITGILIS